MNLALTSVHAVKMAEHASYCSLGVLDMDRREEARSRIIEEHGFDYVWFGDEDTPPIVTDAIRQLQNRN